MPDRLEELIAEAMYDDPKASYIAWVVRQALREEPVEAMGLKLACYGHANIFNEITGTTGFSVAEEGPTKMHPHALYALPQEEREQR